jgi:hypothetical protein
MGRSIKLAALALALVAVCAGRSKADSVLVTFEPSQGFTLGQATPLTYSSGGETITFTTGATTPADTPAPFTVVSQGTNGDVVGGSAPGAMLSGQYLEGAATSVMVPTLGPFSTEAITLTFSVPVNTISLNYYASLNTNVAATTPNSISSPTINYPGTGNLGGPLTSFTITATNNTGADAVLAIDNVLVTFAPEIDPSSAAGALTLLGSAVVMVRGRRKGVRA